MSSAPVLAFATALACALVDWYAVARKRRALEYIFKPATLVATIAAALALAQGPHDGWQTPWFIAGLVLSLAGDVFLMLPDSHRWFPFGLGAFLAAHVCYIVGLNASLPPPAALVLVVPAAAIGWYLLRQILGGLRATGQQKLSGPVIVYGVTITLMLLSAWATLLRPEWSGARRVLVVSGATLFFISDSLLAWNRFVSETILTWNRAGGPFAAARLAIIVTYHLGQFALAASLAT